MKKNIKYIKKKGFTVTEIMVVVAIFSLLIYLSSAAYIRIQKSRLLNDNLWQTSSVVRQAQNKAVSGLEEADTPLRFGVVFEADSYQEFATGSNFAARIESFDLVTNLPFPLVFTNFNLPDTCYQANDCLIFSVASGRPASSGSVSLENPRDGSSRTFFINEEGKVSY
ncbi:hypothetical protein COT75_04080 [Candidatus Beckwithbacteria bacterium CG10_big_fil_rev_8_21_14_0_10_34_10]|uniref:General secretion pathway GspH domain-containing protein n=1 Tax=Candidatus Beckwithbacteria bacterium CG10_big_fil_rev_8_21_14_0_10_34_10 TaxID=1974495 RepID=A0A2H0W8M6_9BACT|nr:MAG: hypothetical protein COT75_04080 [Candidatus Beckwithbacteria bacterium CG10_big_fil_rev_8_21_14_0_10_34_10]